jgi:hypothetical protein
MTPDHARENHGMPDELRKLSAPVQLTGSLAISLLRLDGYANIAAANRHHARDPQRTLKLLQTA